MPHERPLGGGGSHPKIWEVCAARQSEKWARAPEQAPRSSVKMWGSGTSLSRFELETDAGLRILRNELEPFERENANLGEDVERCTIRSKNDKIINFRFAKEDTF